MRKGLLVELIGETGTGKTHTGLLFPNPLLVDMTKMGEGKLIAMKLFSDWKKNYIRIKEWKELKDIPEGYLTYVFDTSKHLVGLLADKWCHEKGKKAVYPTTRYGEVNDMVDRFLMGLGDEVNVVMTSSMTDEYIDGKRTGKRERGGYLRLPDMCDVRIYIFFDKGKRICRFHKNRFVDMANYKLELEEFNYETLLNETFGKSIGKKYAVKEEK